jgi:hypothetical protein
VGETQFGSVAVAAGLANEVDPTTVACREVQNGDGTSCATVAEELACPSCRKNDENFLAVAAGGLSAPTRLEIAQCVLGIDEGTGEVVSGMNPALPPLDLDATLTAQQHGLTVAGRPASLGGTAIQVGKGPDTIANEDLLTIVLNGNNIGLKQDSNGNGQASISVDNKDSVGSSQGNVIATDNCYKLSLTGLECAAASVMASAADDQEVQDLNDEAESEASSIAKPAGSDVQGPFKCYSSEPKGTPPDPIPVTVTDLFTGDVVNVDVLRPFDLCTPVNKDREGVPDPVSNLECYEIQGDDPPNINVTVSTQFGTYDLGLINAKTLCVPAVTARGGGTPDAEGALSHFICYLTSRGSAEDIDVLLEDGFETKQTTVKGEPFMVCNAAQTDRDPNGALADREDHLACYQISDAEGEPQFPGDVENVTDQFNPTGADLDIVRSRLLCERAKVVAR